MGGGIDLFAVGENEAAFEKYQLAVATVHRRLVEPDDLGTDLQQYRAALSPARAVRSRARLSETRVADS